MTKVFMDGADPILIRDLEGRIVDANREVERVFGWTRAELVGQTVKEFLPPEWHAMADQNLERCRRGEPVRNLEGAVSTKTGEVVPILTTAFLLTDEGDRPVAIANILKDITALKQASNRLEQRNRELKQFVSAVSHDLGEPLRAIGGFTEQLQNTCQSRLDDQPREWLQYIAESVDRMQRLIDDLLNYSRLERQEITLQPVDFEKVVRLAVANLRGAIENSAARVESEELPTVLGNQSQLVQLMQNLIGNAIKYRSEKPPEIRVAAKPSGDKWHFTVSDNGIGIEQQHHEKIFDVFHRLHAREEIPGSGIGLATCKVIVERHGSRIWVESRPGYGSTFHFTLPQAAALNASRPG